MSLRKKLRWWELAGFAAVCALGTVLQFLYDWTGESVLAAPVSAVNESTWEHMKMLYIPYFVFTMIEFPPFSEAFRNYFAGKAAAGLVGLLSIPTLFYTLGGMFGTLPDWVNIAIFFVAAAAMYLVSYLLLTRFALRGTAWQLLGFALLWALLFAFIVFTYRAPELPLFRDPQSGTFGLRR